MATYDGSIVGSGNKQGRARMVFTTSETSTSLTVTAKFYIRSRYQCSDSSNTNKYDWDSSPSTSLGSKSVKHTSATSWSSSNITHVATKSKTFTKTTSSQSKTVSYSFSGITYAGNGGTCKVSHSFTVPALASRTITYKANDGTDTTLATATKYYGKTLTIMSAPTRDGYEFVGWNTNANATTSTYDAGSTYSANPDSNVTLYAIWKKKIILTLNTNYGGVTFTELFNDTSESIKGGTEQYSYYVDLTLEPESVENVYTYSGWAKEEGYTVSGKRVTIYGHDEGFCSMRVEYTPKEISSYVYGQNTSATFTLPTPKREMQYDRFATENWGYTFVGWSTTPTVESDDECVNDSITISSDTTLYAIWKRDIPLVAYYKYDSVIPISYETHKTVYDWIDSCDVNIPSQLFVPPENMQYDGWAYNPKGKNIYTTICAKATFSANDFSIHPTTIYGVYSYVASWEEPTQEWVKQNGRWVKCNIYDKHVDWELSNIKAKVVGG